MNQVDLSVYGLIDPTRTRGRPMPDLVREAARAGLTLVQYRDKLTDTRTMIDNARAIGTALEGTGVPLLINDRVDVALAAGADGVHLGQSDMAVADARRLLGPDAIIGLTIKNERNVADAPIDLIDYACIGGVFATGSKDNTDKPIGLDGLARVAKSFRRRAPHLPVGAIAGIEANNAADVIAAGVGGVAVISAIFMADDVATATRELSGIVSDALTRQSSAEVVR